MRNKSLYHIFLYHNTWLSLNKILYLYIYIIKYIIYYKIVILYIILYIYYIKYIIKSSLYCKNDAFKLVIANVVNCHISAHHLDKDISLALRKEERNELRGWKVREGDEAKIEEREYCSVICTYMHNIERNSQWLLVPVFINKL